MPLAAAIIPAVIGAGSAIYSSSQQKKAADRSLAAETAANDRALAAQQANFDRIAGLQQPVITARNSALDAVMARYGLGPANSTPSRSYVNAPGSDGSYYGGRAPTPAVDPRAAQMSGGKPKQPGAYAGTSPMEPPPAGAGYGSNVNNYSPGGAAGGSDKAAIAAARGPIVGYGPTDLPIYANSPGGGTGGPATGATTGATTSAMSGGQPDYAAYGAANPDLQAEWQKIVSTGNAGAFNNDPNAYYASHYQKHGQAEGRDLPMTGGAPAGDPSAPAQPSNPQAPPSDQSPDYGATPVYSRPDQPQWKDMGSGPDSASYLDGSRFQADPSYAWRQSEAARGGNASFGARGLLKSGGAIKAAQDRSFHLADTAYNDWYQQQLQRLAGDRGQFNTNRQADFNIFNSNRNNTNANFDADRQVGLDQFNVDRGFTANQDQQRISNLFGVVNAGTSAAASLGGASTNLANNSGNIFANNATAIGDAAASRASANAGAVGAIGGAAANIFSRYAPSGSFGGGQYMGNAGGNAYGQPGADPFVQF